MSKSCILSLIAGLACTGVALAQDQDIQPAPAIGGEIAVQPSQVIFANPPLRSSGFESRAAGKVYDNQTNHFGNSSVVTLGNCNQVLEDISFAGGPWGLPYANPRQINSITWGVLVTGTATVPIASGGQEAMFLVFWNASDVNFQGFTGNLTNMINPSATPLQVITIDPGANAPGFIYQFTLNALAIDVDAAANGVVLQAGWCSAAAANNPATDWKNLGGNLAEACPNPGNRGLAFGTNTLGGVGANPASVGSTTVNYGRDILSNTTCTAPLGCTHAGVFLGQIGPAATGGCNENRQIQFALGTPATLRQLGYEVSLTGDIIAQPPADVIPLGVLSDNQAPVNTTVATGTRKWYSFTLPNDATDANLSFFDMDTEGSGADLSFAIYDNGGGLIASDDDSGSGTNAQMSFGVGRRASAGGDGLQYDGRTGQLVAGTYYIAVAPAGSGFGSGYSVTPSANAGGSLTLNLHTNVNGTPLAPSVPPDIAATNDFDGLFGPIDPNTGGDDVRQIVAHDTGLRGVAWDRFSVASDIDAAHYLDLEFCTLSTPTADGYAYIFDSQGNIVAISDDYAPPGSLLPGFSFGSGTRDYGCYSLTGSGTFSAGTYYIANALFGTEDLSFLPTGHRWHVRGTSGSNLTMTAVIHAGASGGVTCDPDVNQDGVADQGDVDYLINVVAGGDNPTGINADFNNDGVADQGDVDAIINTIASGMCP